MKKIVTGLGLAILLGAAPMAAQAAEPAGKPVVNEANKQRMAVDSEARYKAYLEREKAADEKFSEARRTSIEDKYKGYVRPKRKKGQAAKPAQETK